MNIVILVSGTGSNMAAIIKAADSFDASSQIVAVISNQPEARALISAADAGIATAVVDHSVHPDRQSFDAALQQQIDQFQPDLVVLAGFMRILTPEFVHHYADRLINIHPSLLPKHKGLKTHEQALLNGDKEHGCTVHAVSSELDSGAIIGQARLGIRQDDTAASLANRVLQLEHQLYPACVRLITQGRLKLIKGAVLFDGQPLPEQGLELNDVAS